MRRLNFETPAPLRLAPESSPTIGPPSSKRSKRDSSPTTKRPRREAPPIAKTSIKMRTGLSRETDAYRYLEHIYADLTDLEEENHRVLIYGLFSICVSNNWKCGIFANIFRDKFFEIL